MPALTASVEKGGEKTVAWIDPAFNAARASPTPPVCIISTSFDVSPPGLESKPGCIISRSPEARNTNAHSS